MIYYDYHIHTSFSEDSKMDLHDACNSAIQHNIGEIAITDHIDIDYPDRSITFDLNYSAYSKAIEKAKKIFEGRLNIIQGIEIGLQPHILNECRNFLEENHFQFIIASVHAAEKKDLHTGAFCKDKNKKTSYRKYLEEIYLCLKKFDHFHILGHIDLIRRYGNYNNKTLKYYDFDDILDEIFKHLIYNGKGLEINTSGYRYGLSGIMPDVSLLTRYRELGGEVLTIGSDAHMPDQLGEHFAAAYAAAAKANFKYLTRFPKGKPEFIKL